MEAINGVDLFGSRGGPSSVIHALPEEIQQCNVSCGLDGVFKYSIFNLNVGIETLILVQENLSNQVTSGIIWLPA